MLINRDSLIAICVWILDVLIKGSRVRYAECQRHLVESLLSSFKKPPREYLRRN